MQESVITFKLKGRPKKFIVYNNLDERGLDIHAAFDNWSVRTSQYTEQSFCEYVISKDPVNIICLTSASWQALNK
jgi:hypothetical protein